MPKKGTKYATIPVDLQKWCRDTMEANAWKQADLCRELKLDRPRVHELYNGKANTVHFLEIIVNTMMRGDYLKMAKYATTDEGLDILKEMNRRKKLTPVGRDVYSAMKNEIASLIDNDPSYEDLDALREFVKQRKASQKK